MHRLPDLAVPQSRKRKYEEEQYDLHDGWIDDTELAAQERKFVAETKQKGCVFLRSELVNCS